MANTDFHVTVKKTEVVSADLPMHHEHWLPMSNLDLLLPPLDYGVFFCYKRSNINNNSKDDDHQTIKKALAETLVSFYALAGEVVFNNLGEPELVCNNRGVDYFHAYADIEFNNLDLYHPDVSVHGKLIPIKKHGVLSVQGAATTCYVAQHPSLKGVTGKYFVDCNEFKPSKLAVDDVLARNLWDFSTNLVDAFQKIDK